MRRFAEGVVQFNSELLGIKPDGLATMSKDMADHLHKCLIEEVREFRIGHSDQDIVDCVDALIDLMYFGIGGLHKMGLTIDQMELCMMAVHEANMSKRLGKIARRAVGDVPDATKPDDWVDPKETIRNILFG